MDQVEHKNERLALLNLPLSVPGLDEILGGGLPEYSFNLITGGPGTGKTTFGQHILFDSARAGRRGLFFTVLGEPTLKVLRYQQQFSFFDPGLVGSAVEFINLANEALQDLGAVFRRITQEIERAEPGVVIVDSFRSIARAGDSRSDDAMTEDVFVQRLALQLSAWELTSFLLGEYSEKEQYTPVFTVADGVLWLSQVTDHNSVVRKLQVVKMRGRAPMPGLHTFRITQQGVQIFPRIPEQRPTQAPTGKRHSMGVPGLDEIMGGGVPAGDVIMIAGPAGSGKTTFAMQFVADAYRQGEAVVVAVFEEYPQEYLARAQARAVGLVEMAHAGKLKLIYLRPLDLSVDETLAEIKDAVKTTGATRVVIDSLSGFEVALAPSFRDEFKESLYRLVGALTATGVTVMLTTEAIDVHGNGAFTNEKVSFVTDNVIAQRYVEMGGKLQKVLVVVKMRGSDHSKEFRTYEVGPAGAIVGGPLSDYHGITTGTPDLLPRPAYAPYSGLTEREHTVLQALIRLGTASHNSLATRVGLPLEDVAVATARFVALGYAVPTDEPETFRAVAR